MQNRSWVSSDSRTISEDEWRFHSRYSGYTACQFRWILGRNILQKLIRRIQPEQVYDFIWMGFHFCAQKGLPSYRRSSQTDYAARRNLLIINYGIAGPLFSRP